MAEKHYLTAKELRKISRENMKTTAAYEKKKKQKVDPAACAIVMREHSDGRRHRQVRQRRFL